MAIKDGIILSRNSDLLGSILGRQSVSFTGALNAASQANRDQINLQAGQEKNFLGERQFITEFDENTFRDRRNFEESTFQDRRNFDESSFRDRRNFSEDVRQFGIQDQNVKSGLSFEGRRLNIAESREAAQKEMDPLNKEITQYRFTEAKASSQAQLENISKLSDVRKSYFDIVNDTTLSDEQKVPRLTQLSREAAAYGIDDITKLADETGAALLLPSIKRSAVELTGGLLPQVDAAIQSGDTDTARVKLAAVEEALKKAKLPTAAVEERLDIARDAGKEDDGISVKAAIEAKGVFEQYGLSYFGQGKTFEGEAAFALQSPSREAFATSGEDPNEEPRKRDLRRAARLKFYDAVKRSSAVDRTKVNSATDPNAAYLYDLESQALPPIQE